MCDVLIYLPKMLLTKNLGDILSKKILSGGWQSGCIFVMFLHSGMCPCYILRHSDSPCIPSLSSRRGGRSKAAAAKDDSEEEDEEEEEEQEDEPTPKVLKVPHESYLGILVLNLI